MVAHVVDNSFLDTAVALYPRRLPAWRKERTSSDRLKITRNFIETIDFSISIYIIMLQSYINAITCIWYVSNTYQSPVSFHVTAMYRVRSTPVYWSRLGRNRYGTNTYLPSNYSRSEYLFPTRSVGTILVTSLEFHPMLLCCVTLNKHGTLT